MNFTFKCRDENSQRLKMFEQLHLHLSIITTNGKERKHLNYHPRRLNIPYFWSKNLFFNNKTYCLYIKRMYL